MRTPQVRPRQDGDPVPDVAAVRLDHRVLLLRAAGLTELADRSAAGATATSDRCAAAVAARVRDWTDAVRAHLGAERELLWPVLAASAGPHVDLAELRDGHTALGPALDRLRLAGDAFAARPGEDTATALAVELAELRDALTEHVGDEEAVVLPALERWVSVRDWQRVQRRTARRTAPSSVAFDSGPRLPPDPRRPVRG